MEIGLFEDGFLGMVMIKTNLKSYETTIRGGSGVAGNGTPMVKLVEG